MVLRSLSPKGARSKGTQRAVYKATSKRSINGPAVTRATARLRNEVTDTKEEDLENAECVKVLVGLFSDRGSFCRGIWSQLPGHGPNETFWNNFHDSSLKHNDVIHELHQEHQKLTKDRVEMEGVLEKENDLIAMKNQELAYFQNEIDKNQSALKARKAENGIRLWETTTRVSFFYQLNQTLAFLKRYRESVQTSRMKPRIEARNHAFNLLQNALGNIRVFCRLRPTRGDRIEATINKNVLAIKSASRPNVTGSGVSNSTFTFDFFHIFGERDSQKMVYNELRHFMLSALHSCNVTLFAYGQTGSGKTYTMEGSDLDEKHQGLRPRALRQIMELMKEWRMADITFDCSYSFIEIYNEQVRDLLADGAIREVKENAQGMFYVANLSYLPLDDSRSVDEMIHEIQTMSSNRTSGSTLKNENSSRSHSIFQVKILHPSGEIHYLTLIDLAGSERLAKTAATGRRAHEAKNINLSLSALNDTLTAIGSNMTNGNQNQQTAHIPFRQSKLTQLLKEPLCGLNGKVAMFVNISTAKDDLNESINSLRFATKVQGVRLKKA